MSQKEKTQIQQNHTNKDHNRAQQSPMRRVFSNFGLLIKGRGMAAVMLFGVNTLMALSLGPKDFGLVIVFQI